MNTFAEALNLPPEVIKRMRVFEDAVLAQLVIQNKLSFAAAQELVRVKDVQQRTALAEQAAREQWKRAQAREAVRQAAAARGRETSAIAAQLRARTVATLARKLDRQLQLTTLTDLPPAVRRDLGSLHRRLTLLLVDDMLGVVPSQTPRGVQR